MPIPFPKTRRAAALAIVAGLAASPALSACFADYRAKMDDPLRLHYGVIEVPQNACSPAAAEPVIAERIEAGGWQLLEVIAVFDESGLDGRRADAGAYFLRF